MNAMPHWRAVAIRPVMPYRKANFARGEHVKTRAWIVLADPASARLYETDGLHGNWKLVAELAHADGSTPEWEVGVDTPGRGKQSRRDLEKFSIELAKTLEHGLGKRAYEQLALGVPSDFLGILREKLSDRVLARVATVVERDYLHMDERKARQRLEEELQGHLPRSSPPGGVGDDNAERL